MTNAQREALQWLADRDGEGLFNKSGVLLARGDWTGVRRQTWDALREACVITIEGDRVRLTDKGRSACAS